MVGKAVALVGFILSGQDGDGVVGNCVVAGYLVVGPLGVVG